MRIMTLVLCCFWHTVVAAEVRYQEVLSGRLQLQMPARLSAMPEWQLKIKYPGSRDGIEAYSLPDGTVSFAFHHTQNPLQPAQIDTAHAAISRLFRKRYPTAQWFQDRVRTRFGRRVIVLELVTPAQDTQIHNLMYGFSLDGRLMLVTFNTTLARRARWLEVGRNALDSLRVLSVNGN